MTLAYRAPRGAATAAAALVAALALSACATGAVRYPGRADVRAGDEPRVRIEETNATETSPRELQVPAGTEVAWLNATRELVFIRFEEPIAEACGTPVRFHRTFDGRTFATDNLAPFDEARLCVATPGRYRLIVSSTGGGGAAARPDGQVNGSPSPVRYGTLVVE